MFQCQDSVVNLEGSQFRANGHKAMDPLLDCWGSDCRGQAVGPAAQEVWRGWSLQAGSGDRAQHNGGTELLRMQPVVGALLCAGVLGEFQGRGTSGWDCFLRRINPENPCRLLNLGPLGPWP